MAVSFNTPKSGSDYNVQVTGTVAAHSLIRVKIQLAVTNTSTAGPRNDSFYRVVEFNNATHTDAAAHGTYALAIIPKLFGTDTVATSVTWDY